MCGSDCDDKCQTGKIDGATKPTSNHALDFFFIATYQLNSKA